MERNLLERLRQCPTLPSLPVVAVKVVELLQSPEADLVDIARIVSKDPALSSKILRTVNSSFYGNGHAVSTISQALVMLGLQAVRTLVVGFSLTSGMAKTKTIAFDRNAYWRRSMYAAAAARTVAARFYEAQQESCFLAALLMDLGMLAFDQVLGEEYGAVTAKAPSHANLSEAEIKALGATHAEVAGLLAKQWKFPQALQSSMEFHHAPQEVKEPGARKMADIVALAGRCADVFVDAKPLWAIADVRRLCAEQYNLDEDACNKLLSDIGEATEELAGLFEIKIDPALSYEKVLARANATLGQMAKEGGEEAPKHERRRASRFKKETQVFILPCLGGVVRQSIKVNMIDVSARGIGIGMDKPMDKGDQFIFQTRKPDGSPMTLLYEVVRCSPVASKGFHVGAELVCVLNDGDKTAPRQRQAGAAEKISKAILT